MINDELLNKFARIKDLPISEELIGAYIEDQTRPTENSIIENSIETNSLVYDIIGDSDIREFAINKIDSVLDGAVFDRNSLYEAEIGNAIDDINIVLNTYGEHSENLYDPIFILQPDDHSCALRCQQIILRDFGIDIPFKNLERIALDNGIYTTNGTYTYDIGKVLELAGVGMHQVTGTSINDLINELSQGHRIIVSVDADELWYNNSLKGRLKNWFNDVMGHQGGNHALIVAGIDVNPNNTTDISIVLTDPGSGDLRISYPVEQFMDAWKDSNCFMVATNNPAPYQYDAKTGMEIPSNFSIQQHFNQFIADNSYHLSLDSINIPTNYQAAYCGRVALLDNDLLSFPSTSKDFIGEIRSFEHHQIRLEKEDENDINNLIYPKENNINDVEDIINTEFNSDDIDLPDRDFGDNEDYDDNTICDF